MPAAATAASLEEEEEAVLSDAVVADSRNCTDCSTFSSLTDLLGSETTVLP